MHRPAGAPAGVEPAGGGVLLLRGSARDFEHGARAAARVAVEGRRLASGAKSGRPPRGIASAFGGLADLPARLAGRPAFGRRPVAAAGAHARLEAFAQAALALHARHLPALLWVAPAIELPGSLGLRVAGAFVGSVLTAARRAQAGIGRGRLRPAIGA